MPLLSASLDAFAVSSLLVLGPLVYFFPSSSRNAQTGSRYSKYLTSFVILHSLYILYTLTVRPPRNLFQSLRLSINVPPELLASTLEQLSAHKLENGDPLLPPKLKVLLSRLGSFNVRTYYIRFGHDAILYCDYCQTHNDFALFALPAALLAYTRELGVLGFITIRGSGNERWRIWGLVAILATAGAELYWILTVKIEVQQNKNYVIMWHDRLWYLRNILFLFLPLLIHYVLPRIFRARTPVANPLTALPHIAQQSALTFKRIRALKYIRGASLRSPELRAEMLEWWEREVREGNWATQDKGVQEMASKLGLGYGYGEGADQTGGLTDDVNAENPPRSSQGEALRKSARLAVQELFTSFQPSPVG